MPISLRAVSLFSLVSLLAGCSTLPSFSSAPPAKQNISLFLRARCFGTTCTLPIQDQPATMKNLRVDLLVATLADAGMMQPVMQPVSGNVTATAGYDVPKPKPNMEPSRTLTSAGLIAGGPAGLALKAVGMFLGMQANAAPATGYQVSPKVPYLSFFRFYPASWIGTQSLTQSQPTLQHGYELLLAAKNGTPVAPGSLTFHGTLIWGDHSQHVDPAALYHLSGNSASDGSLAALLWKASHPTNCTLFAFALPKDLRYQGKAGSGYVFSVTTGQPKGFYDPQAVEKILSSVPGDGHWMATFNMPGKDHQVHQYAIVGGKLYRVSLHPAKD